MNINKLELETKIEGTARVNEIMAMQVNDSNLLPKPITYKDIDGELTNLVDKEFNVVFGNSEIKTFFFAQQRMNEFTKTWEMLDENKNVLPNFKIVTRENNPKPGTLMGGMANIPGEPLFPIGTFEKWDGNKNTSVTCKMKQPYCVDIMYNIKFVTNKLNLLNELNNKVVDKFKSKQTYITVKGHYMPVILEDISDESDYDINERKIFVQNFQLKVIGYIINESDIIFEENITRTLLSIDVDVRNAKIISPMTDKNIIIDFPINGKSIISFKADRDLKIASISSENLSSYNIQVNSISVGDSFEIYKYDRIYIKILRTNRTKISRIIMNV